MITTPTVLILGASCPYGSSTAKQLRMIYARLLRIEIHRLFACLEIMRLHRSLEHYLFTLLLYWHGRSVDDCIEKFAKLPIIHFYGQLGKIPYPQRSCHQYLPLGEDEKKVPGAVINASQGITLLHEKESELREAHDLLTAAERICFLGFGYNPLNLARLQLKGDTNINREVFGTARHFEKSEIAQTQLHLSSTLLCGRVTLEPVDNLTVLRRHLLLG